MAPDSSVVICRHFYFSKKKKENTGKNKILYSRMSNYRKTDSGYKNVFRKWKTFREEDVNDQSVVSVLVAVLLKSSSIYSRLISIVPICSILTSAACISSQLQLKQGILVSRNYIW